MGWFDAEADELSPAQLQFLQLVQDRVSSWGRDPLCSIAFEPAPPFPFLRLCLDLVDRRRKVSILTVGAYFLGDRVKYGQMHNQEYCLADSSVVGLGELEGSLDRLAKGTVDWFEYVIGLSYVYREWRDKSGPRFCEWIIADTGEALVGSGKGLPGPAEPDITERVELR